MRNLKLAGALAATAMLATTAGAMAAEATASVNVRSGPGTAYTVVDVLYAGEPLTVYECRSSGWCLIAHSGPDGWVSSRYINDDDDDDVQINSQSSIRLSFSFGRGNGFSYGGGPRGQPRDLVCLVTFYDRSQVAAGADADVQRAQVMTRAQAEAIDRPNDRRAIFDYGTNQQTRDTCEYLDDLN
ncbi:MAG: SH3 domain-containing protein [Devosia sp.]